VQVLVPVKGLDTCKQRLAEVLDPGQRRSLMLGLLEDVIEQAFAAETVSGVSCVTTDEEAAEVAVHLGARVISDGGLAWNEGLRHALRQIAPRPAAVAFISADLPHLSPGDIDALAEALSVRAVVIGRARDGGTNALALQPPHVIMPAFGRRASAAVHARLAEAAGIPPIVIDRPGLAWDLDTPDDLEHAMTVGTGGRDRAWRTSL
jgi:2-phospho-L-lactate guanylyltransferase